VVEVDRLGLIDLAFELVQQLEMGVGGVHAVKVTNHRPLLNDVYVMSR
jgi:hypothetical protein